MKKRFISFILAVLFVCSMAGTVFASETEDGSIGETPETSLSGPDGTVVDPAMSDQLLFAKLQMELAEIARQQALDRMEQIAECQEEQKLAMQFLNEARQAQSDAESTGNANNMSPEMAAYMDDNGLAYDTSGDDLLMTAEEWDTAVESLESHLEELGKETQQEMLYVQELMGQYNSYSQGGSTQSSNTNVLTSLARGQSMYGGSEAGLVVTALVGGIVLGCLLTIFVQRFSRKKEDV